MTNPLPPELLKAAVEIQGRHPQLWSDFVAGLEKMLDKTSTAFVNAPPEALQVHQGQTRMLSVLISGLYDARAAVAAMPNRAPAKV